MPGFFLGVPDEIQRSVPRHLRGDGDPDLLDQQLEFWFAAGGSWPETWMHFQHGIAHLGRAGSAEKLRSADAIAATKDSEGWRQWVRDHRTLAGQ